MDFPFIDKFCSTYVDRHLNMVPGPKRDAVITELADDIKTNVRQLRIDDNFLYNKITSMTRYTQLQILETYLDFQFKTEEEISEIIENNIFKMTDQLITEFDNVDIDDETYELIENFLTCIDIDTDDPDILEQLVTMEGSYSEVDIAKFIFGVGVSAAPILALGATTATMGTAGGLAILAALTGSKNANFLWSKILEKIGRLLGKIGNYFNKLGGYWKFRYAILHNNTQICYSKCKVEAGNTKDLTFEKDEVRLVETINKNRRVFCLSECYIENFMQAIQLCAKSYFVCLKTVNKFNNMVPNTRSRTIEDIQGFVVNVGDMNKFDHCKEYFNTMYDALADFKTLLDTMFATSTITKFKNEIKNKFRKEDHLPDASTLEKRLKDYYFVRLNEYIYKAYQEVRSEMDMNKFQKKDGDDNKFNKFNKERDRKDNRPFNKDNRPSRDQNRK